MFEVPVFRPVVHTTGLELQCTLCQMIASPKLALDPEAGLRISHQCAIHSAVVFVIIDYLWRVVQG